MKKFNISSSGFFNFTDFILEVKENNEKEVKFLVKIPYETLEGNYVGMIYINELNKDRKVPVYGFKIYYKGQSENFGLNKFF